MEGDLVSYCYMLGIHLLPFRKKYKINIILNSFVLGQDIREHLSRNKVSCFSISSPPALSPCERNNTSGFWYKTFCCHCTHFVHLRAIFVVVKIASLWFDQLFVPVWSFQVVCSYPFIKRKGNLQENIDKIALSYLKIYLVMSPEWKAI